MVHWRQRVATTVVFLLTLSQATFGSNSFSTAGLFRDPLNWGLSGTKQGFGIDAVAAWKLSKGNRKVVVAIIDTGADYTHPDLVSNLWRNPGESGFDSLGRPKNRNGVDDDKNGFIDDEIGWDFVDQDNKPYDTHGHGTHIAGIIGGAGQKRAVGVSPNVSLMVVKYYDPRASGEANLRNTIRAIHYAIDNGATIINYSAGGPSFSAEEHAAILKARTKGILFVSAAGNEQQNADRFQYFPASYRLDNIICVTAIDANGRLLSSSNFGKKTVHIAAPGKDIMSSLPGNGFGPMTGTSQATAFVSGLAALIVGSSPKALNYTELKKIILDNGLVTPTLATLTSSGRRAHAYSSLQASLAKKKIETVPLAKSTKAALEKTSAKKRLPSG